MLVDGRLKSVLATLTGETRLEIQSSRFSWMYGKKATLVFSFQKEQIDFF